MGNWTEVLEQLDKAGSRHDQLRRRYLSEIAGYTGRNTIAYYSGWLQKPQLSNAPTAFSIGDVDMPGLMAGIHRMDCSRGLDLILHTPGGSLAATEAVVTYLRSKFGRNIRAIVPQLAMSAGTMLALACREIVMGKHSSVGPIDPQVGGVPAHGIVEEFATAVKESAADPARGPFWGIIIGKYTPTLIGECKKSIAWAEQLVTDWLMTGMLMGRRNKAKKAKRIVGELGDHAVTKSHGRHYSIGQMKRIGAVVTPLEADNDLQDVILSYHHAATLTFTNTSAVKLIENHLGVSFIQLVRTK